MPVVVGLGASIGVFQGMFYYLGNRYDTFKKEDDTFERKETFRRTTRLPLEQTISEIGEGRGKSRTTVAMIPFSQQQVSNPPDTTSGGQSASRRSTDSRLTPSTRLLPVANEHGKRASGTEAIVHNSSGRRRGATLENWSFVLFHVRL
jgi:hypothetical protein